MINVEQYKCNTCGSVNLIFDGKVLQCKECKTEYPFNEHSGCLNFLNKELDDESLKNINLEDLEEAISQADNSQNRLYSSQYYLESDYSKNLVKEFNLNKGASILDHGCGRGHFSDMFSGLGYNVASADILEASLSHLSSDNKTVCNLAKLPYQDNYFDGVFSLDVFEHLRPNTMDDVINEIYRCLKPGGVLLISFPGNRLPDLIGIHLINIFVFFMRLFGSNYPYMRSNKIDAHINLHSPWYFKKAFKKARGKGEAVFDWRGKPYTTEVEGE